MADVVTIPRKRVGLESAVATVRDRLLAGKRREVNAADVAELTGLPLGLCEPALVELCARYPSRLVVRAGGALAFEFYSLTRPRGPSALGRLFAAVAAAAARWRERLVIAFTYLLAPPMLLLASFHIAALMVTAHDHWPTVAAVPVYIVAAPIFFVVFTAGFLGFVLMQFFPALSLVLLGIAVMCWLLPLFAGQMVWWGRLAILFIMVPLGFFCGAMPGWMLLKMARDTIGEAFSADGQSATRWLWRGMGGLLFGPAAPPDATLSEERRAVALIRKLGGVVTDGDLMALYGWSRWQAGNEFARIVADYGGEVVVDDAGTVVYRFDPLLPSEGAHGDADTRPAAEREAAPRLFGCTVAFAVWALGAAALAMLGLWLYADFRLWPTELAQLNVLEGLGAWPYLPLMALVALRLPWFAMKRLAWRRRRAFLDTLTAALAHPEGIELPSGDRVALDRCVSLGGELVADGEGPRRVRFAELLRERDAAAGLRRSVVVPALARAVYVADDARPDAPADAPAEVAAAAPPSLPSPSPSPSPSPKGRKHHKRHR